MKNFLCALLLLPLSWGVVPGQNVYVNYDLDPELYGVEAPLQLWLDFLATRDDSLGSAYWNADEVKKYGMGSYFLLEQELQFGVDNFLWVLRLADIKVLSVREVGEYHKITSLMEFPEKEGKSNVQYIFHVYAREAAGKWKLYNPLEINATNYWAHTQVGHIDFHYPKYHDFNLTLARAQDAFLTQLAEDFGVPAVEVDYYFAATHEEVTRIRGFDFIVGDNGAQFPSGRADTQNKIAYGDGLGEFYPHEIIHILLSPHYPDCHRWFDEGVATYFGMSRGKELDWHLKRLHTHLLQHPEIDLGNMLELMHLDNQTDYRYVLGGFLVKKLFEKGSYDLLKTVMRAGKSDAAFYATVEKYLVPRAELNTWIREALQEQFGAP